MEDTAVIPDGYNLWSASELSAAGVCPARTNIVRVLPFEPDLEVMVLVNQVQEPVEELFAFLLGHVVYVSHVPTDREDALPSSHRVCSDDGVYGPEDGSDVLRRAARLVVELKAIALCRLAESRLVEGDCQAFEKLLVRLADKVINFITRSPERVYAALVAAIYPPPRQWETYHHPSSAAARGEASCNLPERARTRCHCATGRDSAS